MAIELHIIANQANSKFGTITVHYQQQKIRPLTENKHD